MMLSKLCLVRTFIYVLKFSFKQSRYNTFLCVYLSDKMKLLTIVPPAGRNCLNLCRQNLKRIETFSVVLLNVTLAVLDAKRFSDKIQDTYFNNVIAILIRTMVQICFLFTASFHLYFPSQIIYLGLDLCSKENLTNEQWQTFFIVIPQMFCFFNPAFCLLVKNHTFSPHIK